MTYHVILRSRSVLKSRGSVGHLSSSLSSASETSIASVFDETTITTPTLIEEKELKMIDSDSEEIEPPYLPAVCYHRDHTH